MSTTDRPPINFNPTQTALVIVDLQKGVAGMPTEPYSSSLVIQNTAKLVTSLRSHGC